MSKRTLTPTEIEVIKQLNVSPYTPEYVAEWLNRTDNVFVNAPAALIAMGVDGFYRAVQATARAKTTTPVICAHWVDEGWRAPYCSQCGDESEDGETKSSFCSSCGAQMDNAAK